MPGLKTPLKDALRTTKKHLEKLHEMGIFTVEDLLFYLPRTHEVLAAAGTLADLHPRQKYRLAGEIVALARGGFGRGPSLRGQFRLPGGEILDLAWFGRSEHLAARFSAGDFAEVAGKINEFRGKKSLVVEGIWLADAGDLPAGDFEQKSDSGAGALAAIYPESAPISSAWLREKIAPFLPLADGIPDILPDKVFAQKKFPRRGAAIRTLHAPESQAQLDLARSALAFEELFFLQVFALREKSVRAARAGSAPAIPLDPDRVKKILDAFPFSFTGDQKIALFEILKDAENSTPAARLLEGDVGSGKTAVVLAAAIHAIAADEKT